MSQDVRYRVVRGPVQARFTTPVESVGGHRTGGGHYYAGQILPPEVDPKQIAHLLSLHMVAPVDPTMPAESS